MLVRAGVRRPFGTKIARRGRWPEHGLRTPRESGAAMTEHGASTIKEWMADLVEVARSGRDFETSAGAEPNRSYSYLQFHVPEEDHSILLFSVEHDEGRPTVRAHHFRGPADQVRQQIEEVTRRSGGAATD